MDVVILSMFCVGIWWSWNSLSSRLNLEMKVCAGFGCYLPIVLLATSSLVTLESVELTGISPKIFQENLYHIDIVNQTLTGTSFKLFCTVRYDDQITECWKTA